VLAKLKFNGRVFKKDSVKEWYKQNSQRIAVGKLIDTLSMLGTGHLPATGHTAGRDSEQVATLEQDLAPLTEEAGAESCRQSTMYSSRVSSSPVHSLVSPVGGDSVLGAMQRDPKVTDASHSVQFSAADSGHVASKNHSDENCQHAPRACRASAASTPDGSNSFAFPATTSAQHSEAMVSPLVFPGSLPQVSSVLLDAGRQVQQAQDAASSHSRHMHTRALPPPEAGYHGHVEEGALYSSTLEAMPGEGTSSASWAPRHSVKAGHLLGAPSAGTHTLNGPMLSHSSQNPRPRVDESNGIVTHG
jgi:hypothetical protein